MGAGEGPTAQQRRQAGILRFWRAVEYFSPPKVDPANPRKRMFPVAANRPLPWEAGSPVSRERIGPKLVWQHTVYAGIFSIAKVRDVLSEAFRAPEGEQDFDGRVNGDSALLSFTVNAEGRLIKDSATLSSCAWAVGQTLVLGPHDERWLTGFEEQGTRLLQSLLELGDGKIDVEREPSSSGPDAPASPLGPVAGLMSRLAVTAAKSGLGAAATAVGGSLGPVLGDVAARLVEDVGGELVDTLAARLAGREEGAGDADGAADDGDAGDGDAADGEAADRPAEDPEDPEGPPPEVGTKVLDVYDLAALTRWVAERLGVARSLTPDAIRVRSHLVSARHADESVGDSFLNSFYADDLQRVADVVENGQPGTALADYLRAEAELDAVARSDVRRAPETVLRNVQPSNMPLGRWPADNDKPLVLSQQFAVNRVMETLGADDGRGVYAVNGPPGTGKTTMLRDLIAAVVVRRAERLAELPGPEHAFERQALFWRTEENAGKRFPRTIHPLIPALTGFEMVIASSNNGAVENVTLEVPGAHAIGDAWKPYADYLSGPAGILLDGDAWGAVAARLGRRSNRSDFVQRFWWGEAPKIPGPRQGQGQGQDRTAAAPPPLGLQKLLQIQIEHAAAGGGTPTTPGARSVADASSGAGGGTGGGAGAGTGAAGEPPLGRETWEDAVRRFTRARDRVRELAAERQEIADLAARTAEPDALLDELTARETDAYAVLLRLQEEPRRLEAALTASRATLDERRADISVARTRLDLADAAVREAVERGREVKAVLDLHDAARPGALARIVTREAARRWESGRVPLATAAAAVDARVRSLESARDSERTAFHDVEVRLHAAIAAVQRDERLLAQCEQLRDRQFAAAGEAGRETERRRSERAADRRRLAAARERWGASVPGPEWQAGPDDREAMEARELSAPWMDPEFAEARAGLFLAALDLHRALLATAPDRMRRNLQAAMDVVKGQAPAELPAKTVLAAWQMLFLVVPVVSTTFASMGRMFDALGGESLGWLFVDEAGQAAPQEVVGALWRSRRAVVVGDPLQLEPVVTLPWTGQQRLAAHFSVDPRWAPAASSVQTLADRLNPYGTWLAREDGERVWLGSPLRVHRRCDRLMFDVSNKIAYDGMMVYGVTRDQDAFPLAQWSVWMDVGSLPGEDKWNPEEGEALRQSLDLIRRRLTAVLEEERADGDGLLRHQDADGDAFAEELARRLNESVFVISPFRDVVSGIGRVVGGQLDHRRYGTVHTTQGKEADIVILVLGTGSGQVGSRDWASQKPNLLNVAVTRARRRLIVIGDAAAWSRHQFFRDLAEHDQIRTWTPTR